MEKEITAKDLMSVLLVTTSPEASLLEIIQAMLHEHHPAVIVCENQRAVGIITERDIVRLMARFMIDGKTSNVSVKEVMTQPLITVSEDTPHFQALVIANSQNILHLPVVDEKGALKGLLTQTQLAKAQLEIFMKQREIIESTATKHKELEEANKTLHDLCMIDPLTGIGNRRSMEIDLQHTHSQSLRYDRNYSMLLFDVDHFKKYNDRYGHPAGDEALKLVCRHIQSCVRQSDRLYRYGGEEILLVLPETAMHGTLILAERIILSLAALNHPNEDAEGGVLTISCGIACNTEIISFKSWREMFDHADRSLYKAKERGRNQLAILPPEDANDDMSPRMHKEPAEKDQ